MLPVGAPPGSPSVIAAVALSGGGARAAAFGLGVLEELKATRFELDGRPTTLLDEVGLISGVSGGSVLATYYAAFGDEVFTRFEPEFLLVDFQSEPDRLRPLAGQPVPAHLALVRPQQRAGRTAGPVFRGLTFGDLKARPRGPRLLVTATDLTTGAPFEFTPEQFALICSDLDSVPLSFAVAASSSVPLLLSPMTMRNYAGSCPQSAQMDEAATGRPQPLRTPAAAPSPRATENSQARPYLHLVDGGLVDNLGVRSLLDRTIAARLAAPELRAPAAGLGAPHRAGQRELRARPRRPARRQRPRARHRAGAGRAGVRRRLAHRPPRRARW